MQIQGENKMKIGVRKPSIKKSIKARTTGRLKRSVKRSINPLYGKKGMGWIRDPKKAAYNTVYHRTTVGVKDVAKGTIPKTVGVLLYAVIIFVIAGLVLLALAVSPIFLLGILLCVIIIRSISKGRKPEESELEELEE